MLTLFWLRLKKLSQIIRDPFLTSALLKGVAAGTEHRSLLETLQFECIVDVGANRGQFALIARKVFPGAKIYSFEPLREPAQVFRAIFVNDPNVKLYPYAIGRERTISTLHVTRDDDSSSMLPVTQTQSAIFPGAAEMEVREVTVLPLSQALDAVSLPAASLLKIDVQGFELEVLKGSEDILAKFSHLYVECSFIELYKGQALADEIISWLAQRGFILTGIHNLFYEHGTAIQGDFLFSRK
jgi:FkbM family methyltransferase